MQTPITRSCALCGNSVAPSYDNKYVLVKGHKKVEFTIIDNKRGYMTVYRPNKIYNGKVEVWIGSVDGIIDLPYLRRLYKAYLNKGYKLNEGIKSLRWKPLG